MRNEYSINLAWPSEKTNCKKEYQTWIEMCHKYNIGCIRVFLVPWGMNPIESSDDLQILCEVIRNAQEMCIEVVLVLDTYVNYVAYSYRDFLNSDYGWFSNRFSQYQTLETFLIEKGKTEYIKKIFEILCEIEKYENVIKIELCNEIDQIESKRMFVVSWINNSLKELYKKYCNRFEYHVSISDYRDYDYFSKRIKCKCDIHTYRFPYNTALENFGYINKKFPSAWISEFSCFSDFAYAETIESQTYFSAMIICASFEKCTKHPASWWWEKILLDPVYMNIYTYLDALKVELIKKEITGFSFKEVDKRKQDAKTKSKIKYRMSVLKTNPHFIKQELPAITKYLRKKLRKKYNHNYAIAGYETQSGEQYIILETYVSIEVKYNMKNDFSGLIICTDVIRNQRMFTIKMTETKTLSEGTYLLKIQNE
mgnify:CR=1 FL=1